MFLDLSKAYDCLNRRIEKLELYGIRGNAKNWLSSYLTNRKQCISVTKNGITERSAILQNDTGIAQGSILGPLLFIVFVNDLSSIIGDPSQYIVNFADDTNLLTGCKHLDSAILKSRIFFEATGDWFSKNKLILNKEKTNAIVFRTKQSTTAKPETFKINDANITVSESVKFLGIYINEFLDWSVHINDTVKKLNSVCYGMRVIGKYMEEKILKMVYLANFESVMKYGIIFWGRHL